MDKEVVLKISDLKAALIGASASFMLFLIVAPMIVLDWGPFNLSPPAAFLAWLGVSIKPIAWMVHFLYGIIGSILFVRIIGTKPTILQGIGFGMAMWLIMMLIFSPLMGWGFFGFGDAHLLPVDHPLYLAQGYSYAVITFGLHLVYGIMIGSLNPLWNQVDTL